MFIYVVLCCAMLCYVMLCYVMLCYVMLCYVMLCYVMLCCFYLLHPQSERELMRPVIPEDHQNTIFDKLIQTSLESFITEGEVKRLCEL